jgi:hypothetical protein
MADDGHDKRQENAAHIEAYSQRIIHLRRILPIIAFMLLGLLLLAANPDFSRKGDNDAAQENADNRLLIDQPEFNGRLVDGRAYRFSARQGAQKNNGSMVFFGAQLDVAANGVKPSIFFTAKEGFFDPQQSGQNAMARLAGNVVAKTGDGYELRAPEMEMRLSETLWLAEKGIAMQGPNGILRAARLQADDNEGIYRFRNIQMRLTGAGGRQ